MARSCRRRLQEGDPLGLRHGPGSRRATGRPPAQRLPSAGHHPAGEALIASPTSTIAVMHDSASNLLAFDAGAAAAMAIRGVGPADARQITLLMDEARRAPKPSRMAGERSDR